MTFPVMITVGSGIDQFTPKICFYRLVCISFGTGTQFNSTVCQRRLGSAADPAADQYIYCMAVQKRCKRAITASVRANDLTLYDPAIFHFVHFEFFSMSEMLENFSILICYCNSCKFRSTGVPIPLTAA